MKSFSNRKRKIGVGVIVQDFMEDFVVVYVGFWSKTYKSMRIGKCAGMPINFSIF